MECILTYIFFKGLSRNLYQTWQEINLLYKMFYNKCSMIYGNTYKLIRLSVSLWLIGKNMNNLKSGNMVVNKYVRKIFKLDNDQINIY